MNKWGGLVGKTIEDCGLDRLAGVTNVRFDNGQGDRPMEQGDVLAAEVTEKVKLLHLTLMVLLKILPLTMPLPEGYRELSPACWRCIYESA